MDCPDGCVGCPNPICVCGEIPSPQNEENLKNCFNEKSLDWGECVIDCKSNEQCEKSCVDSFKGEYDSCPCQVNFQISTDNNYDMQE